MHRLSCRYLLSRISILFKSPCLKPFLLVCDPVVPYSVLWWSGIQSYEEKVVGFYIFTQLTAEESEISDEGHRLLPPTLTGQNLNQKHFAKVYNLPFINAY